MTDFRQNSATNGSNALVSVIRAKGLGL